MKKFLSSCASASAGIGLSDLDSFEKLARLSMPVRRRRLQAEHEQRAREREMAKQMQAKHEQHTREREMAKRFQDEYDIDATAHKDLVSR